MNWRHPIQGKLGLRLDLNPFEISIKMKYIDIDSFLLKWLSLIYWLSSFLACRQHDFFFRPHALQNLRCNQTNTYTSNWPQMKCNRSAEHTLHYVVTSRSLRKTIFKLRESRYNNHPACGWQLLNVLRFLLLDSFKVWISVCL